MKKAIVQNKRKRLRLVDKEVQMKYLGLLVSIVLFTSLIFSGIIWRTIKIVEKNQTSLVNSPPYGTIAGLVGIAVLFCLLASVYFGLLTSHRFMGPLYRLKKSIDELVKGSYGGKISFRENDLKFRLAQVYNELSSSLQQRVHDDIAFADSMKEKLRALASEVSGPATRSLKELELELDAFKKQKAHYLEQ